MQCCKIWKREYTQRRTACSFAMGLTCTTVLTGSRVSHLWKSPSANYPLRHTCSRTHQHAHTVGRGGRTAGVYSEDVTCRQNCHSQFTHLPTDNPIQLHTELHMTWAYGRVHGQICSKNLSRCVSNVNIYGANKLCVLPMHKTVSRYYRMFPTETSCVKYIKGQILRTRVCRYKPTQIVG